MLIALPPCRRCCSAPAPLCCCHKTARGATAASKADRRRAHMRWQAGRADFAKSSLHTIAGWPWAQGLLSPLAPRQGRSLLVGVDCLRHRLEHSHQPAQDEEEVQAEGEPAVLLGGVDKVHFLQPALCTTRGGKACGGEACGGEACGGQACGGEACGAPSPRYVGEEDGCGSVRAGQGWSCRPTAAQRAAEQRPSRCARRVAASGSALYSAEPPPACRSVASLLSATRLCAAQPADGA